MRNCVFQYATGNGFTLEDTPLITMAEAETLWGKYTPIFKKHMSEGREPEMAIWVDMDASYAFKKTSAHWDSRELLLRDGELYKLTRIS